MNKIIIALTFALMGLFLRSFACPTCIGRLEKKTPPFFVKNYQMDLTSTFTTIPDMDDNYKIDRDDIDLDDELDEKNI